MDTLDPATSPDQTPSAAYRHLFLALRAAVAPGDDSPLAADRRDQAIIAQVAGLCPANMAEAMLVAQYTAANAQALRCLALMRQDAAPGKDADRLGALASTMMRRAEGALGNLVRLQTMRGKRDADAAAANHAAWIEHAVTAWMRGEGESQEPRHDPDYRYHETNLTPPAPQPTESNQAAPARIVSQPHDPSQDTTHHPGDRFYETLMTHPARPAHPATETGPTPADPRAAGAPSGDTSRATMHRPDDRFLETTMTRADRDTPSAATPPIRHTRSDATLPRTRDGETPARDRPSAPHTSSPLGLPATAQSAMTNPASKVSHATITAGYAGAPTRSSAIPPVGGGPSARHRPARRR